MKIYSLPKRAEILADGPDKTSFLQGLVTNNLDRLDNNNLVYACLLTPQGKFLYDFFMRLKGDAIILDCENGQMAEGLLKKLSMYKLHSDVNLTLNQDIDVFTSFDNGEGAYKDPRHEDIGYRYYQKPENADEGNFDEWDKKRIELCVPDGSRDLLLEKSTLLESRIDKLNGIDFKKGCYMGQELTARMHYRGLAKKHLYTIDFNGPTPAFGEDIKVNDKIIGDMRSSQGNLGIALLKDAALEEDLPFTVLNP